MAAPSSPSVFALDKAALSKTVQQMAIDGDQPPPVYTVKDFKFGAIEASLPYALIPIIDMSCFLSPLSLEQEEIELAKLRSALTTWGCFQAVNHGISTSFLEEMRRVIGGFFWLPNDEKMVWARKPGSHEGYGTASVVSENQVLDWMDRLSLNVFPESERRTYVWPQNPSGFRETTAEYCSKIRFVSTVLFKSIAKSLHLEEDCFSSVFTEDEAVMLGQFNLYPPCPTPNQVYALKPHVDGTGMTVLLQDAEVEGLQVLNNNKWFTVPLIRNGLFVNVGDQMKIMSNGIFESPVHRVVGNVEREKITIVSFINPRADKEIGPLEALVDEKRPRLYKNVMNYGY